MHRPDPIGPGPYNFPWGMKGRPNPNAGKTFPVEVLTDEEVRALLECCSNRSATGLRARALIVVLYRAGLRCAEALALYPKDVDLQGGSITVMRGKGGWRRTVGLDPGGAGIVGRWIDRRAELGFDGRHPLFCTISGGSHHPGRPIYSSQIRTMMTRLGERAEIDKRVHPHGFRHTHAFELCKEGTPLPLIQKQLGHRNLGTTARYLDHFAPVHLIAAINAREWAPD